MEKDLLGTLSDDEKETLKAGKALVLDTVHSNAMCGDGALFSVCRIKNCRLKPIYEGRSFLSPVSYCKGML